ncbi:FadD32-like long-chain-fatty-acid--AMP ligase [Corynebacterium felinum]|uniref:Fatty acid CoA ligase FadD32 n=1 Tax=Corynebacterium felinum TaxID=131318 RepID=A0ABU2B7N1_9CORY|nr:FadD32-like long-chain-fatty-acid--AMP ligase [Corynebacterium felinum]MDF5821510.1 FadD32-like long-chain-fatty-acid--AMP ligase [Corynebacterium felinum]MDR7354029.1 fatty acid CoA ligase FadD32 [Corynebacterium felinum]WJY96203.1 Long-chain-fatty-acid--AMP ligase FadD32 [Corynebacterium felinum]
MDLHAVIGQFFNEKGEIVLRPEITLAGMCEVFYQTEKQAGTTGRNCLRFWDFSQSREGEAKDYSRDQINTRIKAVAARLQQTGTIGDRVVILANNSPEYIFAMLGAMYAGMVPIPLYDPNEPGHADHLKAVIGDSHPKAVLTNTSSAAAVRAFFADLPGAERPRVLAVDSLPDSLAESFVNPMTTDQARQMLAMSQKAPIDLPAFLQYTSGSTRVPAGVMLTNRSILTNVLQIFTAARLKTPLRLVSWLPLHHDMGIILATFVTILGLDMELMAPRDFIQQPSRWIKQLNRRENDTNVYTVVPNFALELAVRYAKPAEGETLDLSAVDGLIVGSEPVTEKAVEAFKEAFTPYGLVESVIRPSYGLAEASLLVTTPQTPNRPIITHFDREKLAEGVAVVVDKSDASVAFASCGQVVRPQQLVIVDPETKSELADGTVGELWCHGDNMAAGYLDRPEETMETFRNTLVTRLPENSRAEGAPEDDRWMATGDLAVIVDNEVYITGRLKDLIIIAGRNHYPQDIEFTVDTATEHVRPAAVAAFAIEGDDVEKLIILAERDLDKTEDGDAAAIEAIRAAVTDAHGVVPSDIRIVAPDEIARSSSGKIARRVNKKKYLG